MARPPVSQTPAGLFVSVLPIVPQFMGPTPLTSKSDGMLPAEHVGCVPIWHAAHSQALPVIGPSTRLVAPAPAKPVGHIVPWLGANATSDHPEGMV